MDKLQEIRRDIVPFTDPGSEVVVGDALLMWRKDGVEEEAELSQVPGQDLPAVKIDGAEAMPYPAFLASRYLADLEALAEFILKTVPRLEPYIKTRARQVDEEPPAGSSTDRPNAASLIADLANDPPYGSTRIILVRGAAGSGKTMALKHMARTRAEQYLAGEVKTLFFYIDAQGRALSRLDDAMARDLQDLRSRFSYNAVPPLVRRGLLVPVIDGFDELLGSGGYDEAFSSLAAFISRLEGNGAVVASARSTFFDYKAFRANAERFAQDGRLNYEVESVDIEPWEDADADELVRKMSRGTIVAKFQRFRDGLGESNRALLKKPFYVSRIADLLETDSMDVSDEATLETLVNAFLRREHGKFLDKHGTPLLDVGGHRRLLVMLADEMWWLETRRLDLETVRVAAELVMDDLGVPPDAARQVIERMPSYGFLSKSGTGVGHLQFEHETFYGYFLAKAFKRCIEGEHGELRRFLARSVLDEATVDEVIGQYGGAVDACTDVAVKMCSVLRTGLGDSVARQNAGRFVARVIKTCGALRDGVQLRHLYFEQEDFGRARLVDPHFQNCHFERTDFTGLTMVRPDFEGCTIQMPKLSLTGTRLEQADPSLTDIVAGVEIMSNGEASGDPPARKYAPDQIRAILVRLGMRGEEPPEAGAKYNDRQRTRIRLVERFLLKMERRFYVAEADFGRLGLAGHPEWTEVYELLKDRGLVRIETPSMSGRPKPLVRLRYPPDLVRSGENIEDGSRPDIQRFWNELLDVT
ncbi:NACHT domain-containing protein [Candidatus Palauibacter sp.]|uniref:NACHT domain-containing protein n=1 Tax=Candidatus Palauibacter sp. TaxID=3101350 RepID=UPI003AF30734